jgi:hypothetical protein
MNDQVEVVENDVLIADKAGLLVANGEDGTVEIIGWVMKDEEYELNEGEALITHFKTAEKLGILEVFNQMKAENTPVKTKKVKDENGEPVERKPRAPKLELTPEMNYKVINENFDATSSANEGRAAAFKLLLQCDNIGKYLEVCKGYTHEKRDGTTNDVSAEECIRYAIKRNVIALDQ